MISAIFMDMIDYFQEDIKRINHALKVHSFARLIGEKELISSPDKHHMMSIIELTAILHDIGIKISEEKYGSPSGKYQEIEGPDIARGIMKKNQTEENVMDRVCFIIGNHHTYGKIDRLDFQIIVEADFLVNIHEDELPEISISRLKEKHFRTETGNKLVDSLYLRPWQ
ncbi:MAG: HD domain-containing protein [Eubacteriaceae bacterium]|nr:HD domain-containing protein [Eubacteriaceae bacterium]